MKKNRLPIIIILLLAVVSILLVLKSKTNTIDNSSNQFAVDDTASITRIFIADKNNNFVTLKRNKPGSWMVNDSFAASKETVVSLLKTMMSLDVKQPVSKTGREQIMKLLATNSTKVEIYQKVFRIDLFDKIKWFPHEKLTKTYYVGMATQDNLGTYMLLDGSEEPYIVFIQGFNGFLNTRYSPYVKDWRDHTVFNLHYNQIRSVEINITDDPQGSFKAIKQAPREFSVTMLSDKSKSIAYDTLKIMDLFAAFENIRFEALLNDLNKPEKDSILTSKPYIILNIEEADGKRNTVKTFQMKASPNQIDQLGNAVEFDRDRLYALINNDRDLVLIQFYVFGRLFKPLSYYLYGVKEEPSKTGKFEIIN
jgi:hypothetical protein